MILLGPACLFGTSQYAISLNSINFQTLLSSSFIDAGQVQSLPIYSWLVYLQCSESCFYTIFGIFSKYFNFKQRTVALLLIVFLRLSYKVQVMIFLQITIILVFEVFKFEKGFLLDTHQSGFQNDKIKLTHDFLVDFSLKWPEKVEFSISVIIENCAWGKSVKNFKYKIYLMKCIQKG